MPKRNEERFLVTYIRREVQTWFKYIYSYFWFKELIWFWVGHDNIQYHKFWEKWVTSHIMCNACTYKTKVVCTFGNGNSCVLNCWRWAKKDSWQHILEERFRDDSNIHTPIFCSRNWIDFESVLITSNSANFGNEVLLCVCLLYENQIFVYDLYSWMILEAAPFWTSLNENFFVSCSS